MTNYYVRTSGEHVYVWKGPGPPPQGRIVSTLGLNQFTGSIEEAVMLLLNHISEDERNEREMRRKAAKATDVANSIASELARLGRRVERIT